MSQPCQRSRQCTLSDGLLPKLPDYFNKMVEVLNRTDDHQPPDYSAIYDVMRRKLAPIRAACKCEGCIKQMA